MDGLVEFELVYFGSDHFGLKKLVILDQVIPSLDRVGFRSRKNQFILGFGHFRSNQFEFRSF